MKAQRYTDPEIESRCRAILATGQPLTAVSLRESGIVGETDRLATLIRRARCAHMRSARSDRDFEASNNWELREIPDDPDHEAIVARTLAIREARTRVDVAPIAMRPSKTGATYQCTPERPGKYWARDVELCAEEPFENYVTSGG